MSSIGPKQELNQLLQLQQHLEGQSDLNQVLIRTTSSGFDCEAKRGFVGRICRFVAGIVDFFTGNRPYDAKRNFTSLNTMLQDVQKAISDNQLTPTEVDEAKIAKLQKLSTNLDTVRQHILARTKKGDVKTALEGLALPQFQAGGKASTPTTATVPPAATAPVTNAISQEFNAKLDQFWKVLWNTPVDELKPHPALQERFKELSELVVKLPNSPVELPAVKDRQLALLYPIYHAGDTWWQTSFPTMQPATLQLLVKEAMRSHREMKMGAAFLGKVSERVQTLPAENPLRQAFVETFVSLPALPKLPEEKRSFSDKELWLKNFYSSNENKNDLAVATHSRELLLSEPFWKFVGALPESQALPLIQNLATSATQSLWSLLNDTDTENNQKRLIQLIYRVAPQQAGTLIQSFSARVEIKFLVQVLQHPLIDQKLASTIISQTLKENPPEPLKPGFAPEERFLGTFSVGLLEGNAPQIVKETFVQVVFTEGGESRQKQLLTRLAYSADKSFLATHFHLVPETLVKDLYPFQLMELADALDNFTNPPKESVAALTKAAEAATLYTSYFIDHPNGARMLIKNGSVALQAKVLQAGLEELYSNNDKAIELFEKLPESSPEAWYQAGKQWKKDVAYSTPRQMEAFLKGQKPENIVQFINGLAEATDMSREAAFSSMLQYLCHNVKGADLVKALALLTDAAWRSLQSYTSTLAAKGSYSLRGPVENYLWHQIVANAVAIKNDDASKVLKGVATCLFREIHYEYSDAVPPFLKMLPAAMCAPLVAANIPKPARLLLAAFAGPKTLTNEVQTLVASVSSEEADTFMRMYDGHELKSPKRAELAATVSSVDCPLTTKLFASVISNATPDELLSLPRPILLSNLKKIWGNEKMIELLRALPEQEAQLALKVFWSKIDWKSQRELIQLRFPFYRMVALSSNASQLQTLASIPAGDTYARMLIPESSFHYDVLFFMLQAFEKEPWKFWTVIDSIAADDISRWDGGRGNPREEFPECLKIIDWYYSGRTSSSKKYELAELRSKLKGDFKVAVDTFKAMDANQKMYLLAALRGPTPAALAANLDAITKEQFLCALLDPEALEKLVQATLSGEGTTAGFETFITLIKELKAAKELPVELKKGLETFEKKVLDSARAGNQFCSFRDFYNNEQFSDVKVAIGGQEIFAHKVLLQLDPYFKQFPPSADGKTIQIADKDKEEALQRLKFIYDPSLEGCLRTPIQGFIKTKGTIEPFFNVEKPYSDVKVVAEGQAIFGHRVILASSLKYFQGLFENTMRDSRSPDVAIEELTYSQVQLVLQTVYSGRKPTEFEPLTEEEKKAALNGLTEKEKQEALPLLDPVKMFNAAWDRFSPFVR